MHTYMHIHDYMQYIWQAIRKSKSNFHILFPSIFEEYSKVSINIMILLRKFNFSVNFRNNISDQLKFLWSINIYAIYIIFKNI